jgi:hypothetical protein
MEILKFDNAPQKRTGRKKSSTKGLLAVAGFAAIAVLGSTLAANISLNNGNSVEFGQGVAVTAACQTTGTITVTPVSSFANAAGAGGFNFSTVSFSGVNTGCTGKTFVLNAYGNTDATPLTIATSGTGAGFTDATFVWSTTGAVGPAISGTTGWNLSSGTLTLGLKGAFATSGAVYKITLQSQ